MYILSSYVCDMSACAYVCVYACMFVSICIKGNEHRDTDIDIDRNIETLR